MQEEFTWAGPRFADIQMLRYRLDGFAQLSFKEKMLVYCLSEATLWGRDIAFDQSGAYNLRIRKMLEAVYLRHKGENMSADEQFQALSEYLRRVWFSNGIHHHYGQEKFVPGFTAEYLRQEVLPLDPEDLPLSEEHTAEDLLEELIPVIFDPTVLPKRVNQEEGVDLIATSACNYYQGLTQKEVEDYYNAMRDASDEEPPSYGLNSTLVKDADGTVHEDVWCLDGKYRHTLSHIINCLEHAMEYASNESQRRVISLLVDYYRTGDLRTFNRYCIEWVSENDSAIDFINGFIEVYGDPLGLKGAWEGIVEYRDEEATRRTRTISDNAQWFEDHSPVDPRFRKPRVKGVTANVICAAMLGGDNFPASAIGINLPNADWIRAQYGSKSVTIGNLTHAYNQTAKGSGFAEEFVIDADTLAMIRRYSDMTDDLHTDLHECLGHGSGQLLPGVSPDALKAYGSTIEEARADLFGLYYMADVKLVELGLLPDTEAWKAQYYSYMMNGLMTQLVRIKPGNQIEEAHMRNRAIIARWCMEKGSVRGVMQLVQRDGRTYLQINDYQALRMLVAQLLAEVQRIKSEGDYDAARLLVEQYGVKIDPELHGEVLRRYESLGLAPYKGFINPVLRCVKDDQGKAVDVVADYTEGYDEQMLRYSRDYSVELK